MEGDQMENFRACPGGRHGAERLRLDDVEEDLRALDVQR
jgi:hypothetical protein